MADYLCRIRLDRAGRGEEEGKLAGEGVVDTQRFYLRLSDEAKEVTDAKGNVFKYIAKQSFIDYIYTGTGLDAIKVQALLDKLRANETLAETTPDGEEGTPIDTTEGVICPLCEKIHVTSNKDYVSEGVEYVHEHIKVCKECSRYYCDGGEKIITDTNDGNVQYPKTHEAHYAEFGHYPVQAEGTEIPEFVTPEMLVEKSLIEKFKKYCFTLDEKPTVDDFNEFNAYFKQYAPSTIYISYKYEVEKHGGYVLRMKIEISPCDYFLKRENEYLSLEELDSDISIFLSYNEPVKEEGTEEDVEDTPDDNESEE